MSETRDQIKQLGLAAWQAVLNDPGEQRGREVYFHCPRPDHLDEHRSWRVSADGMKGYCDVCDKGGDVIYAYARSQGLDIKSDYPKILESLEKLCKLGAHDPPKPKKPKFQNLDWDSAEAVYRYEDEDGNLLFEKARFKKNGGGKIFLQKSPDGKWTTKGIRRVPYRLPVLETAIGMDRVILIVEGEKDVDNCFKRELVATTSPDGAGTWEEEWNPHFKDAKVLIVPDHDKPGYDHAHLLLPHLRSVAKEVRVLDWEKLLEEEPPEKADISWFFEHYDVDEKIEQELWDAGSDWEEGGVEDQDLTDLGIVLEDAKAMIAHEDEELEFVLDPILPVSGFSMLAADAGCGKSTFARNLAMSVVRGHDFLGLHTLRGPVVLMHLEENPAEVRMHLKQLDMKESDKIFVCSVEEREHAMTGLSKVVWKTRPVLIIIDPMQEFLGIHQINDYAECYESLRPVRELARSTGSHLMLLHHTSKAEGWFLGSQGIKGSVDSLLTLRKADAGIRVLHTDKIRYGQPIEEGIALGWEPETRSIHKMGTADNAMDVALCRRIRDVIELEGRPLTKSELREATGAEPSRLWRAVNNDPEYLLKRGGTRTRVTWELSPNPGEPPDPFLDEEQQEEISFEGTEGLENS